MSNTETFLVSSVLLLACFAVRQTLSLNAAKNVLLLHAVQIKFAHQSCDTINERLDAHWKYLETLSSRMDSQSIVISGIDTRLERWSESTVESLEEIREMLPKDEEPTSDTTL